MEKTGQLVRISEPIDPYLELAAAQLIAFQNNAPAILFENVKGTKFPVLANLFGTWERCEYIFRDTLSIIPKLIEIKDNPLQILKNPQYLFHLKNAIPKKQKFPAHLFQEIQISDLPQIQCWPKDGGAFITLPQVYSEDVSNPGIMHSNLGMYRIQISGNDYIPNREIGLHYQIHRGIGVHHAIAKELNKPFKVSIFVGGPPAHTFSAVMPLPEGIPELAFAGVLGKNRFRYSKINDFAISNQADFVITGEIVSDKLKPEGPFGDHLGYYSLQHPFPVLKVEKVFARKHKAIWPFTVVGRPPQEDTLFGKLVHKITGNVIPNLIPGLKQIHAVDEAGVHPLLLAIASERYTPYQKIRQPQEILTTANAILGTGQLSLAKYLFITNHESNPNLSVYKLKDFFTHVLERIDFKRDIHFQTKTTIDTLDYSGEGLNSGSKVIFAAVGNPVRKLATEIQEDFFVHTAFKNPRLIFPGAVAVELQEFTNYEKENILIEEQVNKIEIPGNKTVALIVICDNSGFTAQNMSNFLWVTFTKSNPAKDIYGYQSFQKDKHWGCNPPLVIDARTKPHHASALAMPDNITKKAEKILNKYQII